MSVKVSVFQQDQTTITQEDPKGFIWHKHSLKHKKHNHNSIIIVQTLKNRKKKTKINFIHWVASQQALLFYASSSRGARGRGRPTPGGRLPTGPTLGALAVFNTLADW